MNVIVWLTLVIFLYFVCFRMQNASRCHKHLLKNLEKESRWWVNDKLPLSPVLLFPSSVQFFISFFFPFFCTVSTDECLIVSLAPSHLACNVLSFLASLQGSQKRSREYLVYYCHIFTSYVKFVLNICALFSITLVECLVVGSQAAGRSCAVSAWKIWWTVQTLILLTGMGTS